MPFEIHADLVVQAYLAVKTGRFFPPASPAIDEFEKNLDNNLYKVLSRMRAGSFVPTGVSWSSEQLQNGTAVLKPQVPVADLVAQMMVAMMLENTYPGILTDLPRFQQTDRQLQVVEHVRLRSRGRNWVLKVGTRRFLRSTDPQILISGFPVFDDIKWALMYSRRWLGISKGRFGKRFKPAALAWAVLLAPVLENLYLACFMDTWVTAQQLDDQYERYNDTAIFHCDSSRQAQKLERALISYLDGNGVGSYHLTFQTIHTKSTSSLGLYAGSQFDFLGFSFHQRPVMSRSGKASVRFSPAISADARRKIGRTIRSWNQRRWVTLTLDQIAAQINPVLDTWINYYGRYHSQEVKTVLTAVNLKLAKWISVKYKNFRGRKKRSLYRLGAIAQRQPNLFSHWKFGVMPPRVPGIKRSRMTE